MQRGEKILIGYLLPFLRIVGPLPSRLGQEETLLIETQLEGLDTKI